MFTTVFFQEEKTATKNLGKLINYVNRICSIMYKKEKLSSRDFMLTK
jgi:hypothetical protein